VIKEFIESIKKNDIKVGSMILVDGEWYHVEEIDGDTIWASDKDGKEYEFKIKDIEKVEENMIKEFLKQIKENKNEGLNVFDLVTRSEVEELIKNVKDIKDKNPLWSTMEKNGKEFFVLLDRKTGTIIGFQLDEKTGLGKIPIFTHSFFDLSKLKD